MLAVGRVPPPSSFSSSKSKAKKKTACRLSFYDEPPSCDVDLDSFEILGIARLQVLRRIDVLRARSVTGETLAADVRKVDEQQFGSDGNVGGLNSKDQLSHFILRLAFCQTEELRRWFLQNECALFKLRFEASKASDVDQFLKERGSMMQYPKIGDAEKMRLKPKLLTVVQAGTQAAKEHRFYAADYYRVPFADVLSLVSRREVYLEAGHAYVSRDQILSLIEGKFRASLARSLNQAQQSKHLLASDPRIAPFVDRLSSVAFRYGGAGGGGGGRGEASDTVQAFTEYLKTVMGHSDTKLKPCGVGKLFVSTGVRKPNERDRTCPIAGRVHKSNTQKYTIYFDTMVMEQGCWDGNCQATGRHVYYQLQPGKDNVPRCVKVGWTPPPLDDQAIANIAAISSGNSAPLEPSPAHVTPSKKMKISQ